MSGLREEEGEDKNDRPWQGEWREREEIKMTNLVRVKGREVGDINYKLCQGEGREREEIKMVNLVRVKG